MASACVNSIGVLPESFIDCPASVFPAYGWLSPRISFSREYSEDERNMFAGEELEKKTSGGPEMSDPAKENGEFEFRVDVPVEMLPADELFSDGKVVPLRVTQAEATEEAVISPEARKAFSPKAPRCSSRWRELLGLRKSKSTSSSNETTSLPSSSTATNAGKSIRQFLHRTSKSMSASDAALRLPLLSDSEPIPITSSRFSLSSSSSSHDRDDFPRLSLDSADLKPSRANLSSGPNPQPRVRLVKPRMVPISVSDNPKPLIDHPSAPTPTNRSDPPLIPRRASMDSPRLISSGKIVFESLERSCSTPRTSNGGHRYRNRSADRSYSANVRIAPVLNVPVCSLRGSSIGQLFSSQSRKKEGNPGPGPATGINSNGNSKLHYYHHCNSRLWKASS